MTITKSPVQLSASLPADSQSGRNEYIKRMDQRRKAAQGRREIMLKKMHQTSTTSAMAEKA